MALKTIAVTACFIVVGSFMACSSSSSNGSTADGDGGGGGSTANICPKIPAADIQALLAPPYAAITENDVGPTVLECDSTDLQMTLQPDDADKTAYNTTASAGGAGGDAGPDVHPITGVGDEAYWWANDDGTGTGTEIGPPIFNAHKGTATCYIAPITATDLSKYSMPYSGATIKESDAAVWATKAGKVCTDFFSAAGS